jgi:hypothetical protein
LGKCLVNLGVVGIYEQGVPLDLGNQVGVARRRSRNLRLV